MVKSLSFDVSLFLLLLLLFIDSCLKRGHCSTFVTLSVRIKHEGDTITVLHAHHKQSRTDMQSDLVKVRQSYAEIMAT